MKKIVSFLVALLMMLTSVVNLTAYAGESGSADNSDIEQCFVHISSHAESLDKSGITATCFASVSAKLQLICICRRKRVQLTLQSVTGLQPEPERAFQSRKSQLLILRGSTDCMFTIRSAMSNIRLLLINRGIHKEPFCHSGDCQL